MSQKTLRVEGITNELTSASHFFSPPPYPVASTQKSESPDSIRSEQKSRQGHLVRKEPNQNGRLRKNTRVHARMRARTHASMHESVHARKLANQHSEILHTRGGDPSGTLLRFAYQPYDFIETIRSTVKKVGREELYVRITTEEKNELRAAVYKINELYRGAGGKTSENEVGRIALKFLLDDFKRNSKHSILAVIQEALHA